jgi:hypothetical protein
MSGLRQMLWMALCFIGLALHHLLLLIELSSDFVASLATLRHLTAISALSALLFGLVWAGK